MGTLVGNCLTSITGKDSRSGNQKSDLLSTAKSHGSHPISKPRSIHTVTALSLKEWWGALKELFRTIASHMHGKSSRRVPPKGPVVIC